MTFPILNSLRTYSIKRILISIAPLLAVLFSVTIAVATLRFNLVADANTLGEEFLRKNAVAMARGDLTSISRSLEVAAATYHLVCVEGRNRHVTFFQHIERSCKSGPLTKTIKITSPRNRHLIVTATMMMRQSHLALATALISVQIILLVLLNHTSKLLQREILGHELEKSRAFAALTTMLAHDVRRPLAVTKMAVDMVKDIGDLNGLKAWSDKIIPEIDRASSSVESLLQDVMELGRDGSQDFYRSRVMVGKIIGECLEHVLSYKGSRDEPIEVDGDPSVFIFGHEFRLKRVFTNLIENAIDAAANRGTVKISYRKGRRSLEVSVANTHSFIPPLDRRRVFDLFYSQGKAEGTGLGLAIVKKIVQAHHGRIRCRSRRDARYPDGRTEFKIMLPIADSSGTQSVDTSRLTTAKPKRVAVIDDSVISAEAWIKALGADVGVDIYCTPSEFFDALTGDPEKITKLDLVLTDYYFEGSADSGEHVSAFIFGLRPELPVVLISCIYADPDLRRKFHAVFDKTPTSYRNLAESVWLSKS
jgi:signal transduction histidine kinase